MKRFEKTKGFILGVLVILIIFNAIVPVLAQQIEVFFNTINIHINGKRVADIGQSYKIDNGDEVPYSINYKGTVYLPLRKLGELFDKNIIWNDESKTAFVNDKIIETPPIIAESQSLAQPSSPNQTPLPSSNPPPSSEPKITAPSEGIDEDLKKYGYSFKLKRNSANGIEVTWVAKNNTGKEIKYYTLNFSMWNPVGDPAPCQIAKTHKVNLRFVGPVPIDSMILCFEDIIGYSAACSKVTIDTIDLEYMDGTKETVVYGYSVTR